jgi:uncharacterized protein YbjT (DUF2867 family)
MKKYVITGSLGHISLPIVKSLVALKNEVIVVSSNASKKTEIEILGAKAAIGSVLDENFLTQTFKNADAIYTIIPPNFGVSDWRAYQNEVAKNYIKAIEASGVKYVVNLSSIGAHLSEGNGPIAGLYDFEQMLNKLSTVNVKHLRPSYFFYNLFSQIKLIKGMGIMGSNHSGKLALTHTNDIAEVAVEELLNLSFKSNSVRYIAGDEKTGAEIAQVLGKAIGKPDLKWVEFTDEQSYSGMKQSGLPDTFAKGYTDMGAALRTGILEADYQLHKPKLSKTKLEDFAKEFAGAFSV